MAADRPAKLFRESMAVVIFLQIFLYFHSLMSDIWKLVVLGLGGQVRGIRPGLLLVVVRDEQEIRELCGWEQAIFSPASASSELPDSHWSVDGTPCCDWLGESVPSPWDQYETQGSPGHTADRFLAPASHRRSRILTGDGKKDYTITTIMILNHPVKWSNEKYFIKYRFFSMYFKLRSFTPGLACAPGIAYGRGWLLSLAGPGVRLLAWRSGHRHS